MKDLEIMQQALEALVYCEALNRDVQRQKEQAVYALRERLAQPEQEPVAEVRNDEEDIPYVHWLGDESSFYERNPVGTKFYAHPPRREWVGLTDEEIAEGQRQSWVDKQAFESAAWWAEAKLREKNK